MFWLTYDTPRGTEVFIAEASHLLMARMKASMAGQKGEFQEGHQLDAKTAKNRQHAVAETGIRAAQADRLMPITFRLRGSSTTRFDICSADAVLGTLWKQVLAIGAGRDERWTWTWHAGPAAGPDKHGRADSVEQAQAEIQLQWKAWIDAAGLVDR